MVSSPSGRADVGGFSTFRRRRNDLLLGVLDADGFSFRTGTARRNALLLRRNVLDLKKQLQNYVHLLHTGITMSINVNDKHIVRTMSTETTITVTEVGPTTVSVDRVVDSKTTGKRKYKKVLTYQQYADAIQYGEKQGQ